MAEECRVGLHPGKAFAKMREESHARHRIQSKIQEAKAEGVHNVAEEIGERGHNRKKDNRRKRDTDLEQDRRKQQE